MAFDTVSIVTLPSAVEASTGSGFYHNLGDGRGYMSMDLWLNESPSTIADGTFESYTVGAGAPRGWVGSTQVGFAEGASYLVGANGVNGTKAARLSVGSGSPRNARLTQQVINSCVPGKVIRFVVTAKTSDAARGRLKFDVFGHVTLTETVYASSAPTILSGSYQTFEFNWTVPQGVTNYRAGVSYGTLDGGPANEVAAGSYADIDNFTATVVAASNLPTAPTNVSYTQGATSATLNWDVPVSNGGSPITGYFVGRDGVDSNGYGAYSTTVGSDQRSLTFLSLVPGNTYNLTVAAITINGQGTPGTKTVTIASSGGTVPTGTRNVLLQPFSASSIWNTPIGSNATTTSAGLAPANGYVVNGQGVITSDPITIGMSTSLPLKTLTPRTTLGGSAVAPNWSGSASVRIPSTIAVNDSTPGNRIAALLDADGATYWDNGYLLVTAGGNPSTNYVWNGDSGTPTKTSLTGSGRQGMHGGSHMSGLGGVIRQWEWDDDTIAIQHVLSMNLYGVRFLSTANNGFRWPAVSSDTGYNQSGSGNFYGRTGSFDGMGMGTLLVLPSSYNVAGIANMKARRIATALRDFGAYVVDNTAWDVHAFSVERGVPLDSQPTDFHAQLMSVISSLHYVTNNTSTSIGGGGTPKVSPPPSPAGTGATTNLFRSDVAYTTPIPANPVIDPNNSAINTYIAGEGIKCSIDQYNAVIVGANASTRRFSVGDIANPLTIRFNSFGPATAYRSRSMYIGFPALNIVGGRQHQFVTRNVGTTATTAPDFSTATTYGATVTDGGVTWMHVGYWDLGANDYVQRNTNMQTNWGDRYVIINNIAYKFNATTNGTTASTAPTFPTTLNATVVDGTVTWKNVGTWGGVSYGDNALNGVSVPVPNNATPAPGTDGWCVVIDSSTDNAYGLWQAAFTKDSNGNITSCTISYGSLDPLSGDGRSTKVKFTTENPWEGGGKISRGSGAGINVAWGDARWSELEAARVAENSGNLANALVPHALHCSINFTMGPSDSSNFRFPATTTDGGLADWNNSVKTPEGTRFWLDVTDAEIAAMTSQFDRIMARTARKYGMYVSDYGGGRITTSTEYPLTTSDQAIKAAFGVSGYIALNWPVSKFKALRSWDGT